MANIKEVKIVGNVPFTCAEHSGMSNFLAYMNAPICGLRIRYGACTYRDNEKGGQTATYEFAISGQEAVRVEWIKLLLQAIVNCGGDVYDATYRDIENPTDQDVRLMIPFKVVGLFSSPLKITVSNPTQPFDEFAVKQYLEKHIRLIRASEGDVFLDAGPKASISVEMTNSVSRE